MALQNRWKQVLTGLFFFVICAGSGSAAWAASLDGTSWLLETLNGRTPLPRYPITLNVEGRRIFGDGGCNSYSGDYTGNAAGKFGAQKLYRTAELCMSNEIMVQDREFTNVLLQATSYRIAGNKLMLKIADGKVAAIFKQQNQNLRGTKWKANGIEGSSLVSGTSITLTFGMNGKVVGSAGCNSYSGSYTASTIGKTVSISSLISTKKLCLAPDGIMMQENRFLAALKSAVRYHIERGNLRLMNAAGSSAVSLNKP